MNLRTSLKASHRPGDTSSPTLETLEPRLLLSASSPFELASLLPENGGDGTTGFAVKGIDWGHATGQSATNAGDINGDGIDDLIIGQSSAAPNGMKSAGASYLVFGQANGFDANLELTDLDGANGFTIHGLKSRDGLGGSVSGAGDINGDGFDDLLIAASGADPNGERNAGEVYVIFGKADDFDASISPASLNGANGFVIKGQDSIDGVGRSVAAAGDINGDGFDDLAVGAPSANYRMFNYSYGGAQGEVYIVFGKAGAFDADLELSDLDGSNGIIIPGFEISGRFGGTVSGAGDINGDGFDDLIIGANRANDRFHYYSGPYGVGKGESYVIFGKAGGPDHRLSPYRISGEDGFAITGIKYDDHSGYSVSGGGDINGDGYDDLVIGSFGADSNAKEDAGESYVIFGKASGFTDNLNLSELNGNNGFVITGINKDDFTGHSVSIAGDINGDGLDDLFIGSAFANPKGKIYTGESYVVYGKFDGYSAVLNLNSLNGTNGFVIEGVTGSSILHATVSGAGDINGDGYDDLAIGRSGSYTSYDNSIDYGDIISYVIFGNGGPKIVKQTGTNGRDVLIGTSANDMLVGGEDDDLLVGNGGADILIGGPGDDILVVTDTDFTRVSGGDGYDTLYLNTADVTLSLTGSRADNITGIETLDITGSGANTLTLNKDGASHQAGASGELTIIGNFDDSVYLGSGWSFIGTDVVGADTFGIYTYDEASVAVKVHQSIQINPTPPPAVDGDFTGDGKADILWRNKRDGSNVVWQFDGTAFELETKIRRLQNTDWKLVGTGDFTYDGKNDILWRNTKDGRNRLWEMDHTDFVQRIDLKTMHSQDWQVAGIGDLTEDGHSDILWRNTRNGRNVAWEMAGTELVGPTSLKTLKNQNWQAAGVGDMTGDGRADILWRNRRTGQNTIWRMRGTYLQRSFSIKPMKNQDWQIAGIADFTGDNQADILWRHTTKGLNAVWEMNKYSFVDGTPLPPLLELDQQPASPLLGLWETM